MLNFLAKLKLRSEASRRKIFSFYFWREASLRAFSFKIWEIFLCKVKNGKNLILGFFPKLPFDVETGWAQGLLARPNFGNLFEPRVNWIQSELGSERRSERGPV